MGIGEIMRTLPHRYPFLLVDKIIELEEGKRAVGIKNVTINEPFFQGHFPGLPIMPGVLIMEAMAQVGAVIALIAAIVIVILHRFLNRPIKDLFLGTVIVMGNMTTENAARAWKLVQDELRHPALTAP